MIKVLKQLKNRLKSEKIRLVEQKVKGTKINGKFDYGVFEDTGKVTNLRIRLFYGKTAREQDLIIGKIIVILHEYGHYIYLKRLLRKIQKTTSAKKVKIHLYDLFEEQDWELLLRQEVLAWIDAWKTAIEFGLDKNKRFEMAFYHYKGHSLKAYMKHIKSRKFMRYALTKCV